MVDENTKADSYRRGLEQVWAALKGIGIKPDGNTNAADAIRQFAMRKPDEHEQCGTASRTFVRQVDMMLDGFMETFAEPFFDNTQGQLAALNLAKERGRNDIVERIERRYRQVVEAQLARERERELAEREVAEDERAEYERLKAKYEPPTK